MSGWDEPSDIQWHTLTVRFGTRGPLDASGIPSRPLPPQHAAAGMLREILGTDQRLVMDEVCLVRADLPPGLPHSVYSPPPIDEREAERAAMWEKIRESGGYVYDSTWRLAGTVEPDGQVKP